MTSCLRRLPAGRPLGAQRGAWWVAGRGEEQALLTRDDVISSLWLRRVGSGSAAKDRKGAAVVSPALGLPGQAAAAS